MRRFRRRNLGSETPIFRWGTDFCANAAADASQSGDFLLAQLLWERVHSRTRDTRHLVNMLESARLAGTLQFYEAELASLTPLDILAALGPNYSSELLEEYDVVAQISQREADQIVQLASRVPRQISARVMRKSQPSQESQVTAPLPLPSPWDVADGAREAVVDSEYAATIPEVGHPDPGANAVVDASFRPGGVVCMRSTTSVVASDVMWAATQMFGDLYSWSDARTNRPSADSAVVEVRPNEGHLTVVRNSTEPSVRLDDAVWLAYPLTHAWGHWVRDVLTRYSYLTEAGVPQDVPVIVDSRVPSKFLDFLRLMNPQAQVVALEPGTTVFSKHLWLSPSRLYAAQHPRWTPDEIDRRVNAEPQGFRRLRQLLLGSRATRARPSGARDRVLIDRSLGQQVRALRDGRRLEEVARRSGYSMVDPGSLTAVEQVALFGSVGSLLGLDGSGWFLGCLAPEGASSFIVGNDMSRDSRGRSWMLAELLGVQPNWFIGDRRHKIPGYGNGILHQELILSEETWQELSEAIREQ